MLTNSNLQRMSYTIKNWNTQLA